MRKLEANLQLEQHETYTRLVQSGELARDNEAQSDQGLGGGNAVRVQGIHTHRTPASMDRERKIKCQIERVGIHRSEIYRLAILENQLNNKVGCRTINVRFYLKPETSLFCCARRSSELPIVEYTIS